MGAMANLNHSRWQVSSEICSPVVTAFVALELLFSIPCNVFIIVASLHHGKKNLKKSSVIFLFNLALSNLLTGVLYMPFAVVSSGVGEWMFGSSDGGRSLLCQMHGFVFLYTAVVSNQTLAIISVDRCLYIIKANLYHKIMTWKLALGLVIAIWILDVPFALAPYYGPGLGEYKWSHRIGSCIPSWNGYRDMFPIGIHSILVFAIIVTSSIWTFIFTHGFLKRNLRRHEENLNSQNLDIQRQIYSKRVKNLFGICGAFVLSSLLSRLPYFSIGVVKIISGSSDIVPYKYYAATFVLFLLNTCINPVIQIYFRKDLFGTARNLLQKTLALARCRSSPEVSLHKGSRSKSTGSRNLEDVKLGPITIIGFSNAVTVAVSIVPSKAGNTS